MNNNKTLLYTRTAMLGACALVLSVLESFLPQLIPFLPGARSGLSNIVIMLAIQTLGAVPAFYICIIKALFAGVTRGAFAMVMSLAGGLVSTAVMCLLILPKKSPFGCLGIGVSGALSHNMSQLFVSSLIAGSAVYSYTAPLLIISLVTGSITGTAMSFLTPPLRRVFSKHHNKNYE